MRSARLALLLLLAGCRDDDGPAAEGDASTSSPAETGSGEAGSEGGSSGGSTGGGSSTGDDELPSPYSDSSTGAGEQPSAGPDEVAAAIGDGLYAFLHARPQDIVSAYEGLAVFDVDCPEQQQVVDGEFVDVTVWYSEGCTTDAGVTFTGGGRVERTTGLVEGDRTIDGAALSSEGSMMRIETDDGRFFELTGYLEYTRGVAAEASDGYWGLSGDVAADDTTAAGSTVLTGELRPQGAIYAYMGVGYRGLGGSGSLTGTALAGVVALSFADAIVADVPCALEPAGQFAVRDDAGFWHDIVFDAATFDGEEYQWTGECDGCGAYVAGGEASGEACMAPADLTALLDWEVIPW